MSMREQMARAIFEGPPHEWERMDPIIRDACFRQADAALSALEEPTEAMLNATPGARDVVSQGTWGAMLDAAGE